MGSPKLGHLQVKTSLPSVRVPHLQRALRYRLSQDNPLNLGSSGSFSYTHLRWAGPQSLKGFGCWQEEGMCSLRTKAVGVSCRAVHLLGNRGALLARCHPQILASLRKRQVSGL